MEPEDIKLVLTWKPYPYWLTIMVIEGPMLTTGREK